VRALAGPDEATGVLDTSDQGSSEAWYEIGERLKHACGRLGSATHCLHERPEPGDSRADVDEPPFGQGRRREIRLWDKD